MARIATNKNLQKAKSEKNDEFYTILSDIEKEVRHYKKHFKNKVVLCNGCITKLTFISKSYP